MKIRATGLAIGAALVLACPGPSGATTLPGPFQAFFDSGSSRLRDDAKSVLDEPGRNWPMMIGSFPEIMVAVEGSADRVGPEEANFRLSCARARAVSEYLVARGIPENRIITLGWGEVRPLVETSDGVADPRNRRVDVIYRSLGEKTVPPPGRPC